MSSITKSTGATLVAMLGTVQVTANTMARAVHTTASCLDMLDQYVQDARAAQIASSVDNRMKMLDTIQMNSAMESAKTMAQTQRELDSDPLLAQLYKLNFDKFGANRALIEKKLADLDHRVTIG